MADKNKNKKGKIKMKIELNKKIENDSIGISIVDSIPDSIKDISKLLEYKIEDESVLFLPEQNKIFVAFEKISSQNTKVAMAIAMRKLLTTNYTKAHIIIDDFHSEVVIGAMLGFYKFDKYKSKKSPKNLTLNIVSKNIEKKDIVDSQHIANSIMTVRDIVNTTPEDFYPAIMAKKAQTIAKENDISCEVMGDEYFIANNMGAIAAVGRASRHESELIHLSYKPQNPKKKIVLVGKGLTYDSGGLSLKPSDFMVNMKSDKGGGAVVLGLMEAIAKLQLPYEVHGIVGAVENMVGGDAYKPDDILTAKNGKTIEVKNTDAEGRLVLADCLCYAQDAIADIDYMVDFATLTGACVVGVGSYTTGIMGHDDRLKHRMVKSAMNCGEEATSLPFNRYLKKQLKSEIADISNIASSRYGGALTAGLFLSEFVRDNYKQKWLHCDIAGPSFVEEIWGVNPHGASGVGVHMCLEFIKSLDS